MSRTDIPAPARAPRASLGSSDEDDIFGVFDPRVARRFFGYLGPHKGAFGLALAAVLLSAGAQVSIPMLIGRAVDAVIGQDARGLDLAVAAFALASAI